MVAAAGLAIWVTLPAGGVSLGDSPAVALAAGSFAPPTAGVGDAAAATAAALVVDVEGAVAQPGVHTLAAGSRVSDAIGAAGGYSVAVDIAAAARQLNLAEKLVDGLQIRVPSLADTSAGAPAAEPETPDSGGLIDLNHADSATLDTLPGIGPVTAEKITSARDKAPFCVAR